jgi:hypothetical protein
VAEGCQSASANQSNSPIVCTSLLYQSCTDPLREASRSTGSSGHGQSQFHPVMASQHFTTYLRPHQRSLLSGFVEIILDSSGSIGHLLNRSSSASLNIRFGVSSCVHPSARSPVSHEPFSRIPAIMLYNDEPTDSRNICLRAAEHQLGDGRTIAILLCGYEDKSPTSRACRHRSPWRIGVHP